MADSTQSFISQAGQMVLNAAEGSGRAIVMMTRGFRYLSAIGSKRREVIGQMLIGGVYSLPVAMLVAMFTGMVIALQVGLVLQDWRQTARIGAIVAASMCRELGPVWIGVILAARVGSAMAAELGTMRVSEEIDALEVMSIDPAKFLVMPRMIALTVMAPILTAFADFVGIVGGGIVGKYQLGVGYEVYFREARWALKDTDILYGILLKAPVYGLTIAVVGCALGLAVRPSDGAQGVGKATRNSVVISLVLIIIFNYYLTSIIRYL